MNINDAIKGRRSIRSFSNKKIPLSLIKEIIEAGTWAPSACDIQGWKFIVINDKKILEKFSYEGGASFVKNIPVGILVLYDNRTDNLEYKDYIQSASACIQNMLLKAYSCDLGTCWICNLPPKKRLRKLLSIPKYYDSIALVAIGYYDHLVRERNRKYDLDDLISYNKFNFKEKLKSKNRMRTFLRFFWNKTPYFVRELLTPLTRKFERKF